MPKNASRTILFLGTANHERCRVAEVLFNAVASRMGLPWTSISRGLAAKQPTKKEGPLAARSLKTLRDRGLRDPNLDRAPLQVTRQDFETADRVIALSQAEHAAVKDQHAQWESKTTCWSIPADADPVPAIDREVKNLVARLFGGSDSADVASEPVDTRPAKAHTVKVGRETKGRKGKGVTILSDLPLTGDPLQELATLLKTRCGTGGTVKDGTIEIQGDQRDRLATELEKLGYKVKRVGG